MYPLNEGSSQYRAYMNLMQTRHEVFFILFSSAFSHPFHVDFRSISRWSCRIKTCAIIGCEAMALRVQQQTVENSSERLVAGAVGGYLVGSLSRALKAAVLPAFSVAIAFWTGFSLTGLPVIGVLPEAL